MPSRDQCWPMEAWVLSFLVLVALALATEGHEHAAAAGSLSPISHPPNRMAPLSDRSRSGVASNLASKLHTRRCCYPGALAPVRCPGRKVRGRGRTEWPFGGPIGTVHTRKYVTLLAFDVMFQKLGGQIVQKNHQGPLGQQGVCARGGAAPELRPKPRTGRRELRQRRGGA